MPKQTIHSLVAKNGKYIVLPPWAKIDQGFGNLAHGDPYIEDAQQQWPIATKFVDFDRIFRYAYAGSALNEGWGSMTMCKQEETGTVLADVAINSRTITMTGVTAFVKDWFSGGWVMFKPADGYMYRIVENTVNTGTDTVTITLERLDGLKIALTTSATFVLFVNEYRDVRKASTVTGGALGYTTFVGLPCVPITSTYYHWSQTWGPAWIAAADTGYGDAEHEREYYFWKDGSACRATDVGEEGQRIGVALPHTDWSGTPEVWTGYNIHILLQIAP